MIKLISRAYKTYPPEILDKNKVDYGWELYIFLYKACHSFENFVRN
jgi:hypothetical protein